MGSLSEKDGKGFFYIYGGLSDFLLNSKYTP
jgi:hypothetical protein